MDNRWRTTTRRQPCGLAGDGSQVTLRIAGARFGEDGSAWRCCDRLRPLRRSFQERLCRTQAVHGLVRTRVRQAEREVAVPVAPHGQRTCLRERLRTALEAGEGARLLRIVRATLLELLA